MDPFIADATREGRRREFAALRGLRRRGAGPAGRRRPSCAPRSTRPAPTRRWRDLYRRLIALRAELAPDCEPVAADEAGGTLRLRRGDVELVANFAPVPARMRDRRGRRMVLATHDGVRLGEGQVRAPRARPARRCGVGEGLAGSAPSRSAPPGTARAPTSRSSPSTPTRVELCLFDAEDREARVDLPERTAFSWHGYLPGRRGPASATASASTAPGTPRRRAPLQPGQAADRPVRQGDRGAASCGTPATCCPTSPTARTPTSCRDETDDADAIPKGVVVDSGFDWEGDRPPATPWNETLIYEVHVKGFTKQHPATCARTCAAPTPAWPPTRRSRTCARSASPPSSCCRCTSSSTSTTWSRRASPTTGATTRSASSRPHAAYAADRTPRRAGARVQGHGQGAARAPGIEVILDVVYNHTAEGNHQGPTLSLQGHRQPQLLPRSRRGPRATTWTSPAPATRSTRCTRACCA